MPSHFRIPQSLDGFETAALAAGLASRQTFRTTTATADLSSLQMAAKARRGGEQASWTEENCSQLYSFLLQLDGEQGPTASQLQLVASFLTSSGNYAVEQLVSGPPEGSDEAPETGCTSPEAAVSVSIFLTCQMLQRVQVRILSVHSDLLKPRHT